jgi:hypothetical protein
VEEFRQLGTTLTNENSILEEMKSRLKSECLLSFGEEYFLFSFLSKNLNIKIYRTIILPVAFCAGLKLGRPH